jgi:glycosyltransferase involved in cell wall biosynthesis
LALYDDLLGGCLTFFLRIAGTPPAGMQPGSPSGPGIAAVAVYPTKQMVSYNRLVEMFKGLSGLEIIEGAIANMFNRTHGSFPAESKWPNRPLWATARFPFWLLTFSTMSLSGLDAFCVRGRNRNPIRSVDALACLMEKHALSLRHQFWATLKMLYFDITDIIDFTRSNATPTGIQRVSLRIIGNLVDSYGSDKIRLIAYHPMQRAPIAIDASFLDAYYTFDRVKFHEHCGLETYQTLEDYVQLRYPSRYKRIFHALRLSIANIITRGKAFKRRLISRHRIPHRSESLNVPVEGALRFAPGDTVIIMGVNSKSIPYLRLLKTQRELGNVRIIQFIYDLIPLVTPEHVAANQSARFRDWLRFMSECTDMFAVISKATQSDLISFLRAEHLPEPAIRVIPLAHEFVSGARIGQMEAPGGRPESLSLVRHHAGDIRVQILNAAQSPYVLCVGTIEPRKNGLTLAKAWQSLLEELGPDIPRLVFAGKRGWMIHDFDKFLKSTSHLLGHIKLYESPSDAELAYLYNNCVFSVYPSYYEGWGLPVGESLWFNKFVVTSNTSSMPEVGGSLVDYVDPCSIDSLIMVLRRLIVNEKYLVERTASISRELLRSWKDVSDDLWLTLSAAPGASNEEGSVLCLPNRTDLSHSLNPT